MENKNENERCSPDIETVQTLLDLLNPLHGELDRQTYDERLAQDFDAPRDAEYSVNITAQMERDLTQAVLILENRKREAARSSAGIETPSDGAIYAAVSQRDVTPEEDAMLRKALIASTEKLYDIPGVAQPSQEQK